MNYEFIEEGSRVLVKDAEGNQAGELTFSRSGENILIIDHTAVDDNHRGQGLAQQLVAKAVEIAKKENVKIMPLCPFAKREFDQREEYQPFLHK